MVKRLLQSVLPPPRRPVTWRAALPLVIFLVVYLLVCWWVLDLNDILIFTRPAAFLLLLVTPWVWWMAQANGAGLSAARSQMALATRLLLIGLFVILMAEPRAVKKSDTLSVLFAIDQSDSITPAAGVSGLKYVVAAAQSKPEKDEAGMVVFGKDAMVEMTPGMSFPFEKDGAITSRVARDGTNLEKVLSLSAAILPEENQRRIVLVSDGAATEGSLSRILDELKARQIPVDVLPISYQFDEEAWLERLDLPRSVKQGETYEAAIILSALKPGKGKLTLVENGLEIANQEVEYKAGKNRFVLPIRMRHPGYYEYTATIEPEKDSWKQNNKAIASLYLQGKGKVLLVTEQETDQQDIQYLAKALTESEREVEHIGAAEFPHDRMALLPYDAVVFANVPKDAFDDAQLKALHDGVKDLGLGFLMVGGVNGFGAGGYHNSIVEQILPVSMDITQKKVLPKAALAIILHTCEFPDGNTWAKSITKQAIQVLNDQDEVGVLVYDWSGNYKWLFKLTPAREYTRLATMINKAEISDMPTFSTTMQMALTELQPSDASVKHLIIVSDGDPSPPSDTLLRGFVNSRISVSTVAVFPHGGATTGALRDIANVTGGTYYEPHDAKLLPSIFIKEAKSLTRTLIQEKTFTPLVVQPSPVLKGITGLPELKGYVLTSPKPRAITVLKGPEKEEGEIDPVLATWPFGLGKAAAFTSDLSGRWGQNWVNWDKYRAFVAQLITEIARVEKQGNLRVYSFTAGTEGVIQVEDYAPKDAFLDMSARVDLPTGEPATVPLKQVGPRRYEGRFPLVGEGRYQIKVAGVGDGRDEKAFGGFVQAYSQEYLRFRSDPNTLKLIAERTGGRVLAGNETGKEIYGVPRVTRKSTKPWADWFLILLACLIPLDVGLRRVQLDFAAIKSWFTTRKAEPSQQMFDALRDRKEKVGADLRKPAPGPAPGSGPAGPTPPAPPKERGGPPPGEPVLLAEAMEDVKAAQRAKGTQKADADQAAEQTSVTERLLAAKRRARDEKDQGGT